MRWRTPPVIVFGSSRTRRSGWVATTTLGFTNPLSFTSTLRLSPSERTLTFWISAVCVSVFRARPGDTISISTQNRARTFMIFSFADGGSADVDFLLRLLPHVQRSSGCSQPVVHDAVALQAIRGKPLCLVVGRFCPSKVVQVTTHALGRQALAIKGTDRAYLVTGITVDRRMRPDQREAVLMLIDVVDRHLPSGVAMAEIALGAIL